MKIIQENSVNFIFVFRKIMSFISRKLLKKIHFKLFSTHLKINNKGTIGCTFRHIPGAGLNLRDNISVCVCSTLITGGAVCDIGGGGGGGGGMVSGGSWCSLFLIAGLGCVGGDIGGGGLGCAGLLST